MIVKFKLMTPEEINSYGAGDPTCTIPESMAFNLAHTNYIVSLHSESIDCSNGHLLVSIHHNSYYINRKWVKSIVYGELDASVRKTFVNLNASKQPKRLKKFVSFNHLTIKSNVDVDFITNWRYILDNFMRNGRRLKSYESVVILPIKLDTNEIVFANKLKNHYKIVRSKHAKKITVYCARWCNITQGIDKITRCSKSNDYLTSRGKELYDLYRKYGKIESAVRYLTRIGG